MADAKYTYEHQADDSGLMLVDLLYGEVDDDREHVLARVGEAELEGYGRLRAMMRELPEEEPPAALTAKLLHAAAMHAPQASAARADEARGVWAWLKSVFQPLLMHPGLAAAASLMLVVGVAGALYMTGRFEVAEPRHEAALQIQAGEQAASAEEAEPVKAAEPGRLANEAAAAESTNAPAQDLDSESVAEAANALAPAGIARREEPREPAAELSRERKADKASRSASSRLAGNTLKSKDSDDLVELADDASGRGKQGRSIGASGSAADGASGGVSGSTKKAAPPMRPSPAPAVTGTARDTGLVQLDEAAAPSASGPAGQGGAESQKTKAASSGTRIRTLHDEARDAARQGDCETVQQIGSSIRNQDAVYYRDVFGKDAQLSRCSGS